MSRFKHHFAIPGLLHLPVYELSQVDFSNKPKLSELFSLSKKIPSQHNTLDSVMAHQLGHASDCIPLAQHFSNKTAANVLIATPIVLRADINSTWIQPAQKPDNWMQIVNDMVVFFDEDVALVDSCDEHLILHFKKCDVVNDFPHYLSVLGKKIDAYQDSIREHLDWFKLINEMQMYLHAHPLNKTQSGQPYFNSFWFWGGDSATTLQSKKSISSDDVLLQKTLGQLSNSSACLSIQTDLLKFLKLNTALSLEAFFSQLEAALKHCDVSQVCLDTCEGEQIVVDRWSRYKFWREKPTPLQVLSGLQQINTA